MRKVTDEEKNAQVLDVLNYQTMKLRQLEKMNIQLDISNIEVLHFNTLKEHFEDFSACEGEWKPLDSIKPGIDSIDYLKTVFAAMRDIVDTMYPGEYYPAYEDEIFINKLKMGQSVEDMYNVYRVKTDFEKCPICGGSIIPHTFAISRRDNKTHICSECGTSEAVQDITETMG